MAPPKRRCPEREGFLLINKYTGAVTFPSCGRSPCHACGPERAGWVVDALSDSGPTRAHLITLAGDPGEIPRRMNQVSFGIRHLKDCHKGFEISYTVEPFPSRPGFHVHALSHGGRLPCDSGSCDCGPDWCELMTRLARRQGMGFASTRQLRNDVAGALYALKQVRTLRDIDDEREAKQRLQAYLAANRGRLAHWSRRYLRTPDGRLLHGIKEAIRAARLRRGFSFDRESWLLVREGQLDSLRASSLAPIPPNAFTFPPNAAAHPRREKYQ